MATNHTQATFDEVATEGDEANTNQIGDLHDELQTDIAERAPYANGSEYVAGPPEGTL